VEYSLTHAGQTLQPVLLALAEWGRSTDDTSTTAGASTSNS